jgi:hypothetical protein
MDDECTRILDALGAEMTKKPKSQSKHIHPLAYKIVFPTAARQLDGITKHFLQTCSNIIDEAIKNYKTVSDELDAAVAHQRDNVVFGPDRWDSKSASENKS